MAGTQEPFLIETGEDSLAEWNRRRLSGEELPRRFSLDTRDLADGSHLDLHGADLGGCTLAGSNLEYADLSEAHLYETDFTEARLVAAKLAGAHLVRSCLDRVDLAGARLDGADLREATLRDVAIRSPSSTGACFRRVRADRADFARATLTASDFSNADLCDANFEGAKLSDSRFDRADLSGANFRDADLRDTSFIGANLDGADFRGADLSRAKLEEARMINSRLEGANLTRCSVYGISAWDLGVDAETIQRDLNIGKSGDATITVDDLEVAQFMYLLMNNARLRSVIDTITSKVVLILGRFTEERKAVLDSLRSALRQKEFGFVPIVFDFEKPASRSTGETVATLAGMARFVIADLSDAKSILQELRGIVPDNPSLPVQPLLLEHQSEPGMFDYFRRYPWFLDLHTYADPGELLTGLADVIEPAVRMSDELRSQGD